jgi:hypothetical protein
VRGGTGIVSITTVFDVRSDSRSCSGGDRDAPVSGMLKRSGGGNTGRRRSCSGSNVACRVTMDLAAAFGDGRERIVRYW